MARSAGRSAALVAAGILLSRLTGLVRQRVFAHYLGLGDTADVVAQSFRIPNLLQNLFGEGVLSASFIPVYARLTGAGREEDAGRVAGAVAGLLGLLVAAVVLVGVLATPPIVSALAPGFTGPKRALTVQVVRILFPSTGILVLSAWCLGVLNSHRRFFVSYAAPVAWNLAIIASALLARGRSPEKLAVAIAWGAVGGALLQVFVQLPVVLRVLRGFRLSISTVDADVRAVLRNFLPAVMGRGVVQISGYVDGVIASLLGTGAAAGVINAQMLAVLPVSLFGMSVSAAELPAMSAVQGDEPARHAALRVRLEAGLHRIAYFIVPCAMAFLALGGEVAGGVFQTGRFSATDTEYVWAVLAGATIGLLATTQGRLTASTFYALGDTRTPLRYAVVRVVLVTVLGLAASLGVPPLLGVEARWGAVALTASAGIGGWVEFLLLRRALDARIGSVRMGSGYLPRLWLAALVAAAAGWAVRSMAISGGPVVRAALVLVPFALVYGVATLALRIPAAEALVAQVRRRA